MAMRHGVDTEWHALTLRLTDACARLAALAASGDWEALQHHRRRLTAAMPHVRAAVETITGRQEAPAPCAASPRLRVAEASATLAAIERAMAEEAEEKSR
jgi:hypothetical protein